MRKKIPQIMHKNHVQLKDGDREKLYELLRKGSLKSRTFKRIHCLLELDKGKSYTEVHSMGYFSRVSLKALADNYALEGLKCLEEKPRSGRPKKFTQTDKDEVVKLSCSTPPTGHEYWSLRLISDKMVELKLSDSISHETIRDILKKKDKTSSG
jgi:transposase